MTEQNSLPQLGIAIGSLGTVGLDVARRIDAGIPGLKLQAVSALHRRRAEDRLKEFHRPIPVLPLRELAETADVVIECAPSVVFRQVAESAIQLGRVLIPISVGALIDNWDLVEKASGTGARINVPTGALVGLDAVRAVARWTIDGSFHQLLTTGQRADMLLGLTKHWQANAVVLQLNHGCLPGAIALPDTERHLQQAGYPVMIYEANFADCRDIDGSHVLDHLDSFLESQGISRLV